MVAFGAVARRGTVVVTRWSQTGSTNVRADGRTSVAEQGPSIKTTLHLAGGVGDTSFAHPARGSDGGGPDHHVVARTSALLGAVLRRVIPHILEANVVPGLLLMFLVSFVNLHVAMIAALAWALVAMGRRLVSRRRVPVILVLATFGLSVRTVIAFSSGDAVIYFLQPMITNASVGLALVGSVLVGRPLVSRLAGDFCPFTPEVAARPAVARLFAKLTLLWALVQLVKSVSSFGMYVSLPLESFVVGKTLAGFGLTAFGTALTIWWAILMVRREGLVVIRVPVRV